MIFTPRSESGFKKRTKFSVSPNPCSSITKRCFGSGPPRQRGTARTIPSAFRAVTFGSAPISLKRMSKASHASFHCSRLNKIRAIRAPASVLDGSIDAINRNRMSASARRPLDNSCSASANNWIICVLLGVFKTWLAVICGTVNDDIRYSPTLLIGSITQTCLNLLNKTA